MSSAYLAWSPLILARIASTASVLPVGALCGQNGYFIESRWVPKSLAFAGTMRPRRLNN
jgi:hypothetical protein